MSAGKHNFYCEQGATFSSLLTWKDQDGDPINVTGYSAAMQVRSKPCTDPILTLTSSNGKIALGGALGTITLTLAATETDDLTPGTYIYDLELTLSGVVTRLIEGSFTVSPEVTK
jgi:hypothetical protein